MIDKIEILSIAENKEFDGAEVFSTISGLLSGFAFAIHEPLNQRYPEVFNMTEEEYKEVAEEIEDFIASDEAQAIKKEAEAKSLTTIATKSLKSLFQLMEGDDKEVKRFIENFLQEELDKYGK